MYKLEGKEGKTMEERQERMDGRIIEKDIEKEMRTAYIEYAMSVIVSRALPDVRDGLKPVHRRILYAMHEDGITSDKPYRKCANTVGSVLGRYHPHGDSSVYDAMVRLAQDFSMRYMLIDGHGNFGSVDGDGAAAMRYTEARMAKISKYMLTDIEKNTVDFMPNYDDRLQEPTVLPARIPALLINGSSGIAVGMATNIPPHNLKEVIDGIIKIIDEDEVSDEDLMSVIKGPDFPTEGIILGMEGIKQAYKTGRGKITLRAETEIEEMSGNRQRIIVSSLPYQVNKANLIKAISDLSKERKVEGISECRDESDRKDRVRVVIELKRDANPQVVLNQLFKHTQMQTTFGIIMLALVNGEPKILTLRQCLDCYIDHRKNVILRRTQFELDKALARAHILEGLKIALDNIDEVINIIRSSYDDPKERLMERFGLSDIQAQAILDMRLKTLSGLQREKIDEEYNQLMELIAHLRDILNSERLVFEIIKEELIEIRDKFGDERKTKIVAAEGEIDIEDLIKEEQTVVALTHFGYIKRMPIDTYKSQRRGGKGITGMATREEDFVKQIFTASTHDVILFFTNKGKLYRLRGYEIPEAGRTARGTAIVNLLSLDAGEKVSAVIPLQNFADGKYLLMATKNGLIKKTALKEYDSTRKTGLQGITLKEDDELIGVRLTDGEDNVVLVTRKGMCITFDEKDVRPIGRVSQGVIGIRLDEDDEVIGMESVIAGGKATLLAITENGFGKRTELDEYRVQNRGGKGVITYKITPKTGELIGVRIAVEGEDVMLVTNTGTIIRLKVDDISVLGRSTQGVTLMRTNDGGKVVSVEILSNEVPEDDGQTTIEETE
jgi:DNA gyrase subunit A